MNTTLPRAATALAGLGLLLLTACGEAAPTAAVDDPAAGGVGMAMCAPGVPDCADTATDGDPGGDTAADCVDGVACDDTGATGDERMNPSITIVEAFVGETRAVEQAPGTVADPMRLFLAEAVVEGDVVSVSFNGSDAPCFVVDHAEVVEEDDRVVVTVWAGRPDPAADCSAMVLSTQSVTVQLAAELGSRLLLDGSRLQGGDNV